MSEARTSQTVAALRSKSTSLWMYLGAISGIYGLHTSLQRHPGELPGSDDVVAFIDRVGGNNMSNFIGGWTACAITYTVAETTATAQERRGQSRKAGLTRRLGVAACVVFATASQAIAESGAFASMGVADKWDVAAGVAGMGVGAVHAHINKRMFAAHQQDRRGDLQLP